MTYNPNKHHRRSIRLPGYDYSQRGAYFITMVTQNRLYLFGDIINNQMVLNDAGIIAQKCWVGNTLAFSPYPIGRIYCNAQSYSWNHCYLR